MQAAYLIEVEKWEEALDLLLRAKVTYKNISQMKDAIEQVIYDEKCSQIDTFIRLCCASLKRQSAKDLEGKVDDELGKQIKAAHKETKQEQIENIKEITLSGRSVPLKTERLRTTFKKVENHLNELQEQEKELVLKGGSPADLIKNYLNFVNTLDDALFVIRKDKAEESKRNEQSGQVFNILIQYIIRLKQKASVDRNLLQARLLAQKLDANQLFNPSKQLTAAVRP